MSLQQMSAPPMLDDSRVAVAAPVPDDVPARQPAQPAIRATAVDLAVALAQVDERGVPKGSSFLCLTTGSSRTADIEKILVMGAHGPRRLVVVIHRE